MKTKRSPSRQKKFKSGRFVQVARKDNELTRINHHAAGIDVGSRSHFVAVPPTSGPLPVREFGVFTADLYAIADWLSACGVETVVMESTGVYWIPLYEALEERGFEVKLVDARKSKNVTGRKSDVLDCQWLQQLHCYGLLEGCFRPPDEICVLRGYMRQREMLIKSASSHILHMHKALQQMNLRLDNVVSDITGHTGMRIIKAILAGERDVKKLGDLRDRNCHASAEEIAQSLVGNYREEHLFALRQAVDLFEFYQQKIRECESEMEKYLKKLPHKREDEPPPLPEGEKRSQINFNVRDQAWKLIGTDLFRIKGLGSETVLRLISEVGTDLSRFPTDKQFVSWLGLCPETKQSGVKISSSRTKPCNSRAAAAFRQAAVGAQGTQTGLGAFYRRKKAHLGPAKAITATAHKIARIFYSLVKNGSEYVEAGADAYEKKYEAKILKSLKRRANEMGYKLEPIAS